MRHWHWKNLCTKFSLKTKIKAINQEKQIMREFKLSKKNKVMKKINYPPNQKTVKIFKAIKKKFKKKTIKYKFRNLTK